MYTPDVVQYMPQIMYNIYFRHCTLYTLMYNVYLRTVYSVCFRESRLPLQRKLYLRSSGMLHIVDWWLVTDVSGQP